MNNEIEMSVTNEPDDDNPLFRKVVLRHPDSFDSGERPTISLHLLVQTEDKPRMRDIFLRHLNGQS